MVAIIVWVTLGAFIGWIASLLLKTEQADRSTAVNVGASVVGAVLGGLVSRLMGYGGARIEQVLTFEGVLFTGLGAALLLILANVLAIGREAHP